jgi:hypothetical protein
MLQEVVKTAILKYGRAEPVHRAPNLLDIRYKFTIFEANA